MMVLASYYCAHCGIYAMQESGAVNRAKARGNNLYCGRECSGLARRDPNPPSLDEKRAAKAEYDRQRRAELGERLLAEKRAAYHAAVAANPVVIRTKERERRKARIHLHVEYCRRPEYRAWKAEYDLKYLAQQQFGPFWEAAVLLRDVEAEVLTRASRYELDLEAGRLNKCKRRKIEYGQAVGC